MKQHNLKSILAAFVIATLVTSCTSTPPLSESREGFASPQAGVDSVLSALKAKDAARLSSILGPAANRIVDSGDVNADREARDRFLAHYKEQHHIDQVDDKTAMLHIGSLDWPFPIPIVKEGDAWFFDTEDGIEEIFDRRVGRNELATIEACLAYVDAQAEYVKRDLDEDGLFEYAQRIRSTPGKKDGLYWKVSTDGEASPLGELAAEAAQDGREINPDGGTPSPYHGYLFHTLTAQGPKANGGAYDYMAGDSMIGGFALAATPAQYGESGVMTFIVSHDGAVFQKDRGADAAPIRLFNPDRTWKKIGNW